MDHLDLNLLKTLLINNGVPPPGNPVLKKSFRSIAKELGVDQGTVRKRMKRLQEKRVLKGWYLGVNPGLINQDVFYAWFEIENEFDKDEAIERLLTLPNLERACNYFGSKLKMILLCNKGAETEEIKSQLERLVGSRATLRQHAFMEVPGLHPTKTDLRIVGNLQGDPWKPYSAVAKEIGVSARTVKRRVERLSENGGVYLLPIIDLKALQGVVAVDLVVDYASHVSKPTVNQRIVSYAKEELMFSGKFGPLGYFSLMVANISRVEQLTKWVKGQPGVSEARADVLQDVVLNRNHFENGRTAAVKSQIIQSSFPLVK